MKNIKEVKADGFYLFTGEASANSCFIESITEAKIFIRLANQYLKDYVKVHEYLLTAEAWMMQVRIRSSRKVIKAYTRKRIKNKKPVELNPEIWRIISEQVRLMLAHYVKITNKLENRAGSKVKESYKRYRFDSATEVKELIDKMRNQKLRLIQRNPKYRKVRTHYRIPKELAQGNVILCSKRLGIGKKNRKGIGFKSFVMKGLSDHLVGSMVLNTKISHLQPNPT